MKYLPFILVSVALFSGCTQPVAQISAPEQAKELCVKACMDVKASGLDISNGPCLSNEVIRDWVCDVAHSPRQDVDNQPANQCPAFGKTASHFVEVDTDCNFIRSN